VYEPRELQELEREEREARLRLAEARDREVMSEGEAPTEDQTVLHMLEADWKRALERLRHAHPHRPS
jgi:hypothetical protein